MKRRAQWISAIARFCPSAHSFTDRLLPRWIFLRALGLIYFSAFYSLLFQIKGLVGPLGILPAGKYLQMVAQSSVANVRFWYAPSLLWLSSSSAMLLALCWAGVVASLLVVLNLWPRLTLFICFVCFLSFVSAAGDFSAYQSDGMLLEAGFISLFFAPPGLRPGLGRANPPSRLSFFLLQWEWFRIYFESGVVKLASGDTEWRNFTAMDEYYQNGPLPTWIGWYMQHLPHWFHAATVGATLLMELGLVWMFLLPRRFRIVLFFMVTFWQAGVILTANYAFLNYIVLALGILLADDRFLLSHLQRFWKFPPGPPLEAPLNASLNLQPESSLPASVAAQQQELQHDSEAHPPNSLSPLSALSDLQSRFHFTLGRFKLAVSTLMLAWIFYATSAEMIWIFAHHAPLPMTPVAVLEPFRIANQYGLFAVMTRARYEIEFQGSTDGHTWIAYPFRYKPQALNRAPGIYAPYQPRFDWNLWFASLGSWRDNPIVPNTEVALLANDPDVLSLFASNPFPQSPPTQVRAVLWRYWFTSLKDKRTTGNWWRRELLGSYAPTLERGPDGKITVVNTAEGAPSEGTPESESDRP
jgi:hypothetical protein